MAVTHLDVLSKVGQSIAGQSNSVHRARRHKLDAQLHGFHPHLHQHLLAATVLRGQLEVAVNCSGELSTLLPSLGLTQQVFIAPSRRIKRS